MKELNYSEILLIRQALERLYTPANLQPLLSQPSDDEKKEAERLQWLFKDATKIEIHEQGD